MTPPPVRSSAVVLNMQGSKRSALCWLKTTSCKTRYCFKLIKYVKAPQIQLWCWQCAPYMCASVLLLLLLLMQRSWVPGSTAPCIVGPAGAWFCPWPLGATATDCRRWQSQLWRRLRESRDTSSRHWSIVTHRSRFDEPSWWSNYVPAKRRWLRQPWEVAGIKVPRWLTDSCSPLSFCETGHLSSSLDFLR